VSEHHLVVAAEAEAADAATGADAGPDRAAYSYSIVIPVYNSEAIVGETVRRVAEVFSGAGLRYEIVLVNDGSPERSWAVLSGLARETPHVGALNLLKNYGQHHAHLAGFMEARGDFVITMDDDLQNPPDQALLLIDAALEGDHDVVFGKFERKKAAGYRQLGSRLISMINRRVFGQPDDLAVSNYRILSRDVVQRICASRTAHPYVTGQALMFSNNPGQVTVRHEPRTVGKSNYNLVRILKLVFTILFSYSSYPLRAAALAGFALSALSFLLGAFYLIRGFTHDTEVQGWTTLVVLLSAFNGFIIAMLSMLGEYVVRTLNAVSVEQSYHVIERVARHEPESTPES
jgi:glycosyltransferase involved in cell wall biosynthesis